MAAFCQPPLESVNQPNWSYTPGMSEADKTTLYKDAYEDWQKQLAGLHEVFLEGRRLDPLRLKGLLNRESRAKRRYDQARLRLLGIEEDDGAADDDSEDGDD
jgi:hypothetical protein